MARNRGIPRYRLIVDYLLRRLQGADAERALPSERALALRFGVARNTARRALEELRSQGYVSRVQGSGSYGLAEPVRLVYGLGYMLTLPHFAMIFEWLTHDLAADGYRLVLVETGFEAELLEGSPVLADMAQAHGLVWIAPSSIIGLQNATRFRQRLPASLPLVMVADPLGMTPNSARRFDLVHWDFSQALQILFDHFVRDGIEHPLLIEFPELGCYDLHEQRAGFLAAAWSAGVPDPAAHIVPLGDEVRAVKALLARGWQPDAVIMHPETVAYPRVAETLRDLLPPDVDWVRFGQDGPRYATRFLYRETASICADLMRSRLANPTRPNLRVGTRISVRRHR